MFREKSPQRTLFSASSQFRDLLGSKSFYATLADEAHTLFPDRSFKQLYCDDNGRPCVPPSQMFTLLLLQMHDKCSDAEAIERSRFDVRWAVALDTELGQGLCARTTLQEFRARMHVSETAEQQFKATLQLARRLGVLKGTHLQVALDTTPIFGRGAVKDTYNLIADGIRKLVGALAGVDKIPASEWAMKNSLNRYWEASSLKGEAQIDWSNEQERRIFLNGLVADAQRLLLTADKQVEELTAELAIDVVNASALLRRIIAQDTEPAPKPGRPRAKTESNSTVAAEDLGAEPQDFNSGDTASGVTQASTSQAAQQTTVGETDGEWSRSEPSDSENAESVSADQPTCETTSASGPAQEQSQSNGVVSEEEEMTPAEASNTEEVVEADAPEHLISEMVVIRQGVAPDRIISVHDPEMRHGRKSASNLFDGYKSSVVVDTESRLILAIEVFPGNSPDNKDALKLVRQAEANTGATVGKAIGDCAYGDGTTRQQFDEAGIILSAKVPSSPSGDAFPKSRFQLDLTNRIATCPTGQTTTDFDYAWHRDGRTLRARFSKEACGRCPERDACLRKTDKTRGMGRTVVCHPQEHLLQAARLHQASPEFKDDIKARQVVEHQQARLVQLGLRQSRYFGRIKTKFQATMIAILVNLTLLKGGNSLLQREIGQLFIRIWLLPDHPVLSHSHRGGLRLVS
jgi:hypothetical protein